MIRYRLKPTTLEQPAPRASNPPSLGWMFLLAAALFALALPIVGPLDDHHFAERAHTHEHIYLNGRPVPHGHAYDSGLRHLHPAVARESEDASANRTDGILYIAPAAAGLMLAVLSAPYHTPPDALRPPPPRAKNANPLARYADPTRGLKGADVPPPLPPPVV